MHRIILNAPNHLLTDHIDRNGLNNQKSNLRLCTYAENSRNRKAYGKSKYHGVFYSRNSIRAAIYINNKLKYLGNSFKTEKDAANAYDKAAKIYFGEFANLNFK